MVFPIAMADLLRCTTRSAVPDIHSRFIASYPQMELLRAACQLGAPPVA